MAIPHTGTTSSSRFQAVRVILIIMTIEDIIALWIEFFDVMYHQIVFITEVI